MRRLPYFLCVVLMYMSILAVPLETALAHVEMGSPHPDAMELQGGTRYVGNDRYYQAGDTARVLVTFDVSEVNCSNPGNQTAIQFKSGSGEIIDAIWQSKSGKIHEFTYEVTSSSPNGIFQLYDMNPSHCNIDEIGYYHTSDKAYFYSLMDGKVIIDTQPPVVTSVTSVKSVVKAGDVLPITVTFNEPVHSYPDMTAHLNNGAVATYTKRSADKVYFEYVVQPGDDTDDLQVEAFNLYGQQQVMDYSNNFFQNETLAGGMSFSSKVIVDTTSPEMTADPSTDLSYARFHDVVVTAQDRPGLEPELFYVWSENAATPSPALISGTGAFTAQPVPNPVDATGTYYLHMRAVDDVGNESVRTFGPYAFDNTVPSIEFTPISGLDNEPISITVSASDALSGVNQIRYQWAGESGEPKTTAESAFTVSSPPNEGAHVLVITAEDQAGNTVTVYSGEYTIDQTAPLVEFAKEGNSDAAQSHTVTVRFPQGDQESGRIYANWSEAVDPPAEDAAWELLHDGPYPAELPLTTPSSLNGTWYLHVKTTDSAGNTAIHTTPEGFVLDNEAPAVDFTPNGSNGVYAATAEIQLLIDGKSAGFEKYDITYWISEQETLDESASGGVISEDGTIALSGISGIYYVYAKVVDEAGNAALVSSQPYALDHLPPTGGVSFVQPHTNKLEAQVKLEAADNESQDGLELRYSNDLGETWSEWLTFTPNLDVALQPEEGSQFLMVKYKDRAGLVSQTYTAEVIYDTTPPEAVDVSYSTTEWTSGPVTATVFYTDDYSPDDSVSVSFEQNGTYTMEFTDLAGNVSQQQVTISNIEKQKPAVQLSVDGTTTKQQTVSTTVSVTDNVSAPEQIELYAAWSMNPSEPPLEWEEITSDYAMVLSEVDGQWYLWTKAIDGAGNEEIKASQPFRLDNTPPVGIIHYSASSRTAGPVTARLELSETATVIIPSSGAREYTFTDNGTYTFEFVDEAGNAGAAAAEVTWIDQTLPTAQVTMTPDHWTNQPVDVQISVKGNPPRVLHDVQAPPRSELIRLERVEDGSVTEVVYRVSTNGPIRYTIEDVETGIRSEMETIVDHIDRVPPAGELIYSHSSWTRDNVTVTLVASDDRSSVTVTGEQEYTFTDNGTHTFTFYDEAGNLAELTAVVDYIDREAPHPIITYSKDSWTNESVTASVYFDNESGPVYILNNGGSEEYVFENNGTFTFFYEDAAGNSGEVTASVHWIDRIAPTGKLNYSSTGWTTSDVVVTLTAEDNSGQSPTIVSEGGSTHVFKENGTFTFVFMDEAGNRTELAAIVQRIDRTPPTADVFYSVTGPTNAAVRASLNPNEPITVLNNNGSRVVDFNDNGQFTFQISDRAGNISTVTAIVQNIDRQAPIAQIHYSTTALTNQDVIATVTANEPIYVLNNNRSLQHVFRDNGSFTFIIQDLAGNTAHIDASVSNIDKTKADITIAYSETEPTTGNVTATVESDRPLAIMNNNGSPTVTFTSNGVFWIEAKDAMNNPYLLPMTVTNIDREKPQIRFTQGERLLIPVHGTVDPLADMEAFDQLDGDVSSKVTAEHEIDASTPGDYEVTYKVRDRAGNETIVVRQASVIPMEELTVYVNSVAPVDGEMTVWGSELLVQWFGQQGSEVVKWAYGKLHTGDFKGLDAVLEAGMLVADKQGYYTILVQDQERSRKFIHVYVIPNR
ncbi:immunoglobulin-like domain-containing protein [Marinicrinis lubricantis]|uniref:Immunoglobulin-like domain-containing protein n=1 Tax=Marinicrinis lubricantis TaxID=2086470 RepID=A0ABW1IR21_9BACL